MENCKDYGFRDQIQRAAVSIMNNIAEGFESGSDSKFMNFLNIARGSCGEVRSMLYLCEDLRYCTESERMQFQSQIRKITSGIVKLSNSIQKNKETTSIDSKTL
ncbi:MAG: four helix bundle protein [Bacteroidales bacterium]|nr:four helix bundle protein [Bacteroidales bacterium]